MNDICNQSGPPRLVARSEAGAVVAVKILVEEKVILPMRIFLELARPAEHRPPARVVAQENASQSSCNLACHLKQVHHSARTRGTFDLEIVTEEQIPHEQCLNEQDIDREPDRAAPVGVPAEQT